MSNFNVEVNQFPSLTWNHLKINRTNLEYDAEKSLKEKITFDDKKVTVQDIEAKKVNEEVKSIESGMGKAFDNAVDEFLLNSKGFSKYFCVKENAALSAVKILLENNEKYGTFNDYVVKINAGAKVNLIVMIKDSKSSIGLRIRVIAEENSDVKISVINLVKNDVDVFTSIGSVAKDKAKIEVTEIALGGKHVYSGNKCELTGFESKSEGHTAYFVKKDSSLDINYVCNQRGKNTDSKMNVDGVVSENGSKVWRGTIDFIRGCVDSTGDEQENVLLLSPKLVNKTLPVILCDEEAVEGRHGASIGKLSSDILFYMQSHGISEDEAKLLMIKAKVYACCRFVNDEETENEVLSFIDGVI